MAALIGLVERRSPLGANAMELIPSPVTWVQNEVGSNLLGKMRVAVVSDEGTDQSSVSDKAVRSQGLLSRCQLIVDS